MKISFFETRTRIFSFNLVLRDENENFFFQSRVSRREREIENHFWWSRKRKSSWFSREFPGSRILAMLCYRITMFECTQWVLLMSWDVFVCTVYCVYCLYSIHNVSTTLFSLGQLFSVFTSFNVLNNVVWFTISLKPSPVFRELWKIPQAIHSWWGFCPLSMGHGPAQIFSGISVKDVHLIDQLKQVILGGVHPHGPHGPAQLLRADVSTSVNVKLIEGLQQKCHIFGKRCKIGIIRWAKTFSK